MRSGDNSYALRLPASLKAEAERLAAEGESSLNQFIAIAVAEKISARRAFEFWRSRNGRSNSAAFEALIAREGGAPPRPDDEIPPDLLERLAEKGFAPPPVRAPKAPAPASQPRKARSRSARRRSPRA